MSDGGSSPDFVLQGDGRLVSTKDIDAIRRSDRSAPTQDLVEDLILSGRSTEPEDHVPGVRQASSDLRARSVDEVRVQASDGRSVGSTETQGVRASRPGPPPPPTPPPPPVPRSHHSSKPPKSGGALRSPGPPRSDPAQRVIRGTPDVWAEPGAPRKADGMEFDRRSLAEVAVDRRVQPNAATRSASVEAPPSGPPPTPEPESERSVPYRPQALKRPIRERTRAGGASGPSPFEEFAPTTRGVPSSLQMKAEMLYHEAMKEVAVGNIPAARRHLQLALSFAPGDERLQRVLSDLTGGAR